ncbi:MAG: hypothetical protein P8Y02_10750, partial [Deinococcales bacterium]
YAQDPAAIKDELTKFIASATTYVARRGVEKLRVTPEQFNSLVDVIAQTPGSDLVRLISPRNQFSSTVDVTIEAIENTKLFDKGQLVESRQIHLGSADLPASQDEIRNALTQLKGDAVRKLRRAGLDEMQVPDFGPVTDDIFTSLLLRLHGPVTIGLVATDDIYRDVARRLSPEPPPARDGAPIERFDVREAYYDALERLLDMDVLASAEGRLVHDAMGGAACGWLKGFVRSRGLPWGVEEVRGEPHPLFYGVNPEPIAVNLTETREHMTASDAVFAAATDGDGDRLGVVLPGGAFFNAHQIFAVLLDELAREGRPGAVVKTFTVSRVVERLAALRGREVVETPVGFKYIVEAMLAGDVLIGGEESGGFGVAGHLPERDGIANALLLLQGVVHSGQPLAERFAAIERETGWRHAYDRLDLELSGNALKERVMAELRDPPQHVGGREVRSVERRDGVKLNLGDDAWLLYRPSGTEPVLRIYCEAPTAADVGALLDAARAWVDTLA